MSEPAGKPRHSGRGVVTTELSSIAKDTLLEVVLREGNSYSWFAKIAASLGVSARTVRAVVYGERDLSRPIARQIAERLVNCADDEADALEQKAQRMRDGARRLEAEIVQSKRQMEQDARGSDNSYAPGLALARRQVAQDSRLGSSQSQAKHAHGRPMRPHSSAFAHHVRSHEAAA